MPSARGPNFLCICVDQMRADHLSCAGHPVIHTPGIDRLASIGVHCQRAYVNNPLCMPSRATMFTGRTPRGHRVRTNGIPLDARTPTMVEALRQSGYRTHAVGKLHVHTFSVPRGVDAESLPPGAFPESREVWQSGRLTRLPSPYYGFETSEFVGGHGSWVFGEYINWLREQDPEGPALLRPERGRPTPHGAEQAWTMALPEELHYTTWVGDRALTFLQQHGGDEQPFFLWCSFSDPHHPYCPPEPWASAYRPEDIPLPCRREGELDEVAPHFRRVHESALPLSGRHAPTRMSDQQLREILALTFGMIALIDLQVGRLVSALEQLRIQHNTVVVFVSDHGDMMGDHWMINKGPFHFDGLLRVPMIWSWPGRFPQGRATTALASLLDFAPTVLELAGVPIPEGEEPASPVAELQRSPWPGVSLVPLLRGEADAVQDSVVVENDEDYLGLQLRTLITPEHKLTMYAGQEYGELFCHLDDPDELHNLWEDPGSRSLRDELQRRLLHRLVMTDSVLPRRLTHA